MSNFWVGNIEAGRQMRLFKQRTINNKLIHAPRSQVIQATNSDYVETGAIDSSYSSVITLDPLSSGVKRAFNLYVGGLFGAEGAIFEIIVRSIAFGDDSFFAKCSGDQDILSYGKGDYYLMLYFSHETDSIEFQEMEGNTGLNNEFKVNASYGPALFRQESLNV